MKALTLAVSLLLTGLSPALADGGGADTITYTCDGGKQVTVAYLPRLGVQNRARVTWAGHTFTLPPTRSADGARYSNGHWTWWSRGQGGFLQIGGRTAADNCVGR